MEIELDKRLEQSIERRDFLAAEAQKIQGKKEAAENSLRALRAEIESKNLDPDKLDETVQTLTEELTKAITHFEAEVDAAEKTIQPFLEKK